MNNRIKIIVICVFMIGSMIAGCVWLNNRNENLLLTVSEENESGDSSGKDAADGGEASDDEEASADGETSDAGETSDGEGTTPDGSKSAENAGGVDEATAPLCEVAVYVCGQVENPGVYYLSQNSRLYEAIDAAGGFSKDACREYLNLADRIADGMKIYVPAKDELSDSGNLLNVANNTSNNSEVSASTATSLDGVTNQKVNINTATKEELMGISGVGKTRAEAIISYRNNNAPFSSIEDIKKVSGIKEGLFAKIKDYITV